MWFSAKCIFVSKIDGHLLSEPLCEESIILFEAESLESARQSALDLAKKAEHSYKNEQGEEVEWRFEELIEVQDLCEEQLYSGVEVFSRLFRRQLQADAPRSSPN